MSPWTEFELATLKRLAAEGYTAFEAATVIGRPVTGVRHKAYSIGTPLRYEPASRGGKVNEQPSVNVPRVPSRDTRSLTRYFFGDPPPGRSALDMRGQG